MIVIDQLAPRKQTRRRGKGNLNPSKNTENISGERLFLRYAYPCAEVKEQRGVMISSMVAELDTLVNEGGEPSHALLCKCFENAVRSYHEFTNTDPASGLAWPISEVRRFWRAHRGVSKQCAVMCGEVEAIEALCVWVKCEGKSVLVINRYKLPVLPNDTVYFHKRVVAEVE